MNKNLNTCGCKEKPLLHVKVFWGNDSEEFNYCKDCIKEDLKKGMLIEIL